MCFHDKTIAHPQRIDDRDGEDIELHCKRLRDILKTVTDQVASEGSPPRILLSEIESLRGYPLSRRALHQSLWQSRCPGGHPLGVALVDYLLRWVKGEASPQNQDSRRFTRMPYQETRRLSGCIMFLLNVDPSFLGARAMA